MLNKNFIILNNCLYLNIDYEWILWIEVTARLGLETLKTSYETNEHLFFSLKIDLNMTLSMVVYRFSSTCAYIKVRTIRKSYSGFEERNYILGTQMNYENYSLVTLQ